MAILRKLPKSRFWFVQLKLNGRTITRSTKETDKRKAQSAGENIERQVRLLYGRPNAARMLSEGRVAEVERVELDVNTRYASRVESMLWNFEKWLGDVPMDRINSATLESYRRFRQEKASKETIKKELCYIVKLLRQNGLHVEKPKVNRGRVTEQRALNRAELKAFFEHCPDDQRALFLLMLCTGARPAELVPSFRSNHVALLKSELDVEQSLVTIRSAKIHEGQRASIRKIGIQPKLMADVVAFAEEHALKTVFLPILNLGRYFDRIIKDAGIEKYDALGRKVTAHSFRHTFATLVAESVGHNPFVVKQVLGHSQITTTDRYCHPTSNVEIICIEDLIGAGVSTEAGEGVSTGGTKQPRTVSEAV